jgi:hypothetical protein
MARHTQGALKTPVFRAYGLYKFLILLARMPEKIDFSHSLALGSAALALFLMHGV